MAKKKPTVPEYPPVKKAPTLDECWDAFLKHEVVAVKLMDGSTVSVRPRAITYSPGRTISQPSQVVVKDGTRTFLAYNPEGKFLSFYHKTT